MSLTAKKTGTLIGTAVVSSGSPSGVGGSELKGTATITYGGAPTSNTAFSFPGTSGNYIDLGSTNPANIDTSVSNVFVEAWFYAFSYPSNVAFILYKGGNNINNEDFGLWVSGLYGVNWRLWNTAGAGFAGVTGSNNLNINQWYHVAGSWDVGTKTIYTFLNGTLLGPGTLTGTPRYNASSRVQIGAANSAGFLGDYYPFNGYIRDVRIVSGGIVPTTSFTPQSAPFGLGSPRYLTASMGPTVLSLYTQYIPSVLNLPGTNGNYMLLPSTHPTNFDPGASSLFIEAWVYWNGANFTATNGGTIYERENAGSTVQDYGLYTDNTGTLTSYMYTQNGNILRPTFSTALSVKRWYHVAFGYSTLNQTAYIWVNGNVGITSSASGNPARYSSVNTFIGNFPLNAGFGQTYAWNGYIQDMRVTRGGIIPTTSFTPVSPPFSLLAPSYVPGGTCVLSLATQYFLNTLARVTPSGIAGGYGADVTGGDQTQIIAGNKVHFFTTVGTQTVTVTGSGYVTVLVVAGGGGGGYDRAAGGGAGGLIYTQMILQPGTYTVTVGAGGAGRVGSNGNGANGANSVFGPLTAIGGGGGGSYAAGFAGGSGGGGFGTSSAAGGARTADQGNVGGAGLNANLNSGGGGGANGAGVAGGNGINAVGGNGGPGKLIAISGTPTYYAGGGGGSIAFDSFSGTSGNGLGGIGGGGNSGQVRGANGSPGTANTGGGGGGGANIPQGNGGNGGSGIVIISYPTSIPSQIINNYLFSQISTSTMAAAYSLRSLTGGAVRAVNVRRSSDNATQDFLVDTAGNMFISLITRQTLESWLGNSTGYVTTWYDQTTAARNASQPVAAYQPLIQKAKKGSGYMLVYTGSQIMNAFSYTVLTNSKYTICMAERRTVISGTGNNGNNTGDNPLWSYGVSSGATNAYPHYTWRNTNTLFYGQYGNDLGGITSSSFLTSSTEPIRYHYSMVSSTSGAKNYIYNDPLSSPILTQNAALTGLPNMSGGPLSIGYNNFYPGQGTAGVATGMFYIGEMYEFIVFNNSLFDIDGTGTINKMYGNQSTFYI
jgi:hypothetical protein